MQDESGDPPAVLFATMIDQRTINSRYDLKGLLPTIPGQPPQNEMAVMGILSKVRVAGAALSKLTEKKGSLIGYLDYVDDDAAKNSVSEFILPALEVVKFAYFAKFREPLAVRDMNRAGS